MDEAWIHCIGREEKSRIERRKKTIFKFTKMTNYSLKFLALLSNKSKAFQNDFLCIGIIILIFQCFLIQTMFLLLL